MAGVGVITGLAREAVCIEVFPFETRPPVEISGIGQGSARKAALALVDEGCNALVSFGVCGGLDPALKPGTIVMATQIVTNGKAKYDVNSAWLQAFHNAVAPGCTCVAAPILGSSRIIAKKKEKRELFRKTGAAAVDMESHEVAEVAGELGIPFLAVRAIADPARRRVPSAAFYGIHEDGTTNVEGLLAALIIRPWQIPALFRLALDSYSAQSALRRVAALTTPGFSLG